jgi:hypothetical protein
VGNFGFLPYQARATVLERDLSCRPCSKMEAPFARWAITLPRHDRAGRARGDPKLPR